MARRPVDLEALEAEIPDRVRSLGLDGLRTLCIYRCRQAIQIKIASRKN